jgi:uncharacterized protein (TIGR00251 family)
MSPVRKEVKVIPSAGKDYVREAEGMLIVMTKSPARENRANASVLKLLSRHFGRPVRMVSGFKSRRKVVEIQE